MPVKPEGNPLAALVKGELDTLLRDLGEELNARAVAASTLSRRLQQAKDELQPKIDACDAKISELVDRGAQLVGQRFWLLFERTKTLTLPNGTVSAKDTTPSHDIIDEDALLALLEEVGALETVAPPTRKVNITELKKLPKVLQEAVMRGVVSIEGSGEQTVTIKPSNAETKGAPKLARSIPSPAK